MAHTAKHASASRFLALAILLLCASGIGFAQDAVSSPSMEGRTSFLDFPGKVNYHMTAGWASTGLLFAAGVMGAARAWDLMSRGHAERSRLGIDEEDSAATTAALASVWADGQTLRWVHVGLLAAGETLYLGNAVTGLSMKLPKSERTLSADIHLISFFTHAALMASEILLGVMTTDALKRGDHEAHLGLVTAHAAIGLTIPIVMAGAGLAETMDLSFLQKR